MIEVAQAFLAVLFLPMVCILLPHYYSNLSKNLENTSLSQLVNNSSVKPVLIKFTVKHTLVNNLCFVKTFLKVTEKNTFCM